MDPERLFAIVKKEMRHIIRDPRSLISAIVFPICLMFIYCSSLSLDVKNLPICVMDYDNTPRSRELLTKFTSSGYFTIVKTASNYREMFSFIDGGECIAGLRIPGGFGESLRKNGGECSIQLFFDGSDPNKCSVGSAYASMILQNTAMEENTKGGRAFGLKNITPPVSPYLRVWFNPTLESRFLIIPGLIVLIMTILSTLLTSTTISKEWENGTMELLISSPVTTAEIIIGKLVPYFILGFFDTIVLILLGYIVYNVPIKGSLALLLGIILLFLYGVLMTGISVSAILKSSLAANVASIVMMFLPTIVLSGFIFFVPAMPKPLQYLSSIMPATYFTRCSHGIYLRESGWEELGLEIFMLLLFNILATAFALSSFKKRLD